MKPKQLSIVIILNLLIFSVSFSANAQSRKFRQHQVLEVSGGQKVEILSCRGEGENEECDVIYYTAKRQTGKRFWQQTAKIREEVKVFKDSIVAANRSKTILKNKSNNTGKRQPVVSPVNKSNSISVATEKKVVEDKAADWRVKRNEETKNDNKATKNIAGSKKVALQRDSLKTLQKEISKTTGKAVVTTFPNAITDTAIIRSVPVSTLEAMKKLSVFIDCNTGCDMNYIRTELTIVDFLLDMNAADVYVLINAQQTGGGGSAIQIIFYGQNKYKNQLDTLIVDVPPNSTEFEWRAEMLKGIKRGLVPFLLKTGYAKYLDVNIKLPEHQQAEAKTATKDPWNYWVFRIGADGSLNSDQVYKTVEAGSYITAYRTTDKLKVSFSGSGNYNRYNYNYTDNGSSMQFEVLNSDYNLQHSIVKSLGAHWGIGYLTSLSNSTFSNNERRMYGKIAAEYSIFPYKDVNTRFFTLSYGVDARANT